MKRVFAATIWLLLLAGALKMCMISAQYFSLKTDVDFLSTKQYLLQNHLWHAAFLVHVFTSFVLLFTGLFQLIPQWHQRFPKGHRMAGVVYLITLLVFSAPSGLILGWYANGGLAAKASFLLMGTLWWWYTAKAYLAIRKLEFAAHGEYLLRSFALSASAITLRLYALILGYFHTNSTPLDLYTLIAWMSWVPNLLVAESLIRKGFAKKYLAKRHSVVAD